MPCGEQEKKEAGYLDELNYLFYHARYSETSRDLIPVVIWLSGGPGCSSMIGAIFENGPSVWHWLQQKKATTFTLKGIAIGNGFVSARAIMSSYVECSRHNDYHVDFLASEAESLEQNLLGCIDFINDCMPFMTSEHRNYADASVCSEAENKVWQAITKSGKNYYDLRRTCSIEDSSGLCYEFDALQSLMNKPSVRTYFRSNGAQTWRVCNEEVYRDGASADFFQESEYEVAYLLNSGVRVLVYAGDADAVCNWVAQYNWTQNLEWKHSDSFRRSRTNNWMIDGAIAGTFRSSYNLTFVRVKNAGHMVPHDQPKVALRLLESFITDSDLSNQ